MVSLARFDDIVTFADGTVLLFPDHDPENDIPVTESLD
jgi:hypothetical protein